MFCDKTPCAGNGCFPLSSTATPSQDMTGAPEEGLVCQHSWLCCVSCKGLRPFAARRALPWMLTDQLNSPI